MNHGTCIHFNGFNPVGGRAKCAAGVDYAAAFGGDERPGLMLRMPCIAFYTVPAHGRGTYVKAGETTIRKEVDRRGEICGECVLRQEPTTEQVEQDRIESDKAMERAMAGILIASTWRVRPRPEQDRREVVECPICRGRLHLSQSAINGHVHGKCETQGCMSWLE